jgi:hypothetical protein
MLTTDPGVQGAGYQALALVEGLIDILLESGALTYEHKLRIVYLASEKLAKTNASVQQDAGKLLAGLLASHQKF